MGTKDLGIFEDADVISRYTRAQALADGVLVNLSLKSPNECRETYKHPIACTASVWGIIDRAVKNKNHCNDLAGVVWDILWMSKSAVYARPTPSEVRFQVFIKGAGRQQKYDMRMVVGPGDSMEPVMTLMLVGED